MISASPRPETSSKPPGLIVALDIYDLARASALARRLAGRVSAFKVGLGLYAAHGPRAVSEIASWGPLFCDLKFHDIPAQVGAAVTRLGRLGVWMLTVHASGGARMIAAAAQAAAGCESPPVVAAVTVLTSLDRYDLATIGQPDDPGTQALRLGQLAVAAGAGALVCSPAEAPRLRVAIGAEPLLVCPGIRPSGVPAGDQIRIGTPAQAAAAGADYLVVGRPITEADHPEQAVEAILEELEGDRGVAPLGCEPPKSKQ
ncbi:MAG: orotidine-5'-phosphate decarboxylase [Actinomycetota bacterium]